MVGNEFSVIVNCKNITLHMWFVCNVYVFFLKKYAENSFRNQLKSLVFGMA